MLRISSGVALRRTYSSWSTSLRFTPSPMRWMTYSRTFSWRPDRRGVPKSLSQKDLLLSATFALAFLSSSPLYRGFLPEERKFRQGGLAPTLEGGLPLFTSGREGVFSETGLPLLRASRKLRSLEGMKQGLRCKSPSPCFLARPYVDVYAIVVVEVFLGCFLSGVESFLESFRGFGL